MNLRDESGLLPATHFLSISYCQFLIQFQCIPVLHNSVLLRRFHLSYKGNMCVLICWTFPDLLSSNRHVSEMKQNLIIRFFNIRSIKSTSLSLE